MISDMLGWTFFEMIDDFSDNPIGPMDSTDNESPGQSVNGPDWEY